MSKSHRKSRKLVSLLPLVANRCNYEDATHWGSYWTKSCVLDYAAGLTPPIPYADLYAAAASRSGWIDAIRSNTAIFVCGVGHGNESVFTGQNQEYLLNRGDSYDLTLMIGRYGSFLSCVFGQAAETFVNAGMLGFFGYTDTYWFEVSTYPDDVAGLFFKSHFTFDRILLGGGSLREAYDQTTANYNAAIAGADAVTARYLIGDRDAMHLAAKDESTGPYKGSPAVPPDPGPQPSTCGYAKATAGILNAISSVLGRRSRFIVVVGR